LGAGIIQTTHLAVWDRQCKMSDSKRNGLFGQPPRLEVALFVDVLGEFIAKSSLK